MAGLALFYTEPVVNGISRTVFRGDPRGVGADSSDEDPWRRSVRAILCGVLPARIVKAKVHPARLIGICNLPRMIRDEKRSGSN